MLKTQAILYHRSGAELARYRYPCYPMLRALIERQIAADGGDSLASACEVLARTAAADAGNVQELVLTNTLPIVVDVLHRALASLTPSSPRDSPVLRMCIASCQATAAAVGVPRGREEVRKLEDVDDNRRSLMRACVEALRAGASHCPALTAAAIYVCIGASQQAQLLACLLEAGVLWELLACALRFEAGASVPQGGAMPPAPSLGGAEEGEATGGDGEGGSGGRVLYLSVPLVLNDEDTASARNWLCILALWALSALGSVRLNPSSAAVGARDGSDAMGRGDEELAARKQEVRESLEALLTPSVAREMIGLHQSVGDTAEGLQICGDAEAVRSVAVQKASGTAADAAREASDESSAWILNADCAWL